MTKEEHTIQTLVEMRDEINVRIQNYVDGYFYICTVRSYGRNWKENYIFNFYTLQELCNQYNGDDGIVDVFSNNPNLSKLDNYGNVMFVPTVKDYDRWLEYTNLACKIPEIENELDKWDDRDNVPFNSRPYFAPIFTREDLEGLKIKLDNFDMSFVEPVRVKPFYEYED